MNRKSLARIVILAVSLLSFSAFAIPPSSKARRSVPADAMKFTYEGFEEPLPYVCKHQPIDAANPYDWKVQCFEGATLRAEYVAHVALSVYERPTQPAMSVELLYWITSGTNIPGEVGSTTWMHFKDASKLALISTSQTIERGQAGLYLEIQPDKAFTKVR